MEGAVPGLTVIRLQFRETPAAYVPGLLLKLFGVIGANMGPKFLVALQREDLHHFIERCAGELLGKTETPAAF